jgi:hypothetical protein
MSIELIIFAIAMILSLVLFPILNHFFPTNFED